MKTTLQVRHVTLRVQDLERSLGFYVDQLGFVARQQTANAAALATSPEAAPILGLREDRTAPLASPAAAGLFHAALLFPNRGTLAGWLRHAAERGVEFDGFSDHAVSEAIYLSDPDGNGLEFYADRARALWPITNGQVEMVTRALDVPLLLQAAAPATPVLAGATWGHLHLRVTDLERSELFYTDKLGMAVMQRSYPGARFLAADGYHHHVGLNVWSHPRQPQATNALGLAEATFGRLGLSAPSTLRDPDGIALRIEPLPAP